MTRQLYEDMAEIYIKGTRTANEIVKGAGVIWKTANKAIQRGWPEHGWAPLKERAAFYDKLHADTQNKESPARAKEARDFLAMREEYLRITHAGRTALEECLGVVMPLIPGAARTKIEPRRFERMEEIVKDGKVVRRVPRTVVVDVEVPLSIVEVSEAVSKILGALERTGGGELEQLLARPPAQGKRKHNLSTEQIRFMAENNGQLPTGVKLEDLGDG